jgi:hypothetical protein
MRLDNLTEENFEEFAVRSYINYRCLGREEFLDDLLHIKYIKRLFRKYADDNSIDPSRMRLALNHLIILYNVFKSDAITRMLFFRLEPRLHPILKTFLVHLNFMPAIVHGIRGSDIHSKTLDMDEEVLEQLRSV